MTYEQRGTHIRKRKAAAIQAKFRRLQPAKYDFSNRRVRPVLADMRSVERKIYLRGLVKFATADSYNTLTPLSKQDTTALEIKNIKSAVRGGKRKVAKNKVYKNLTYASLLSSTATKLIF